MRIFKFLGRSALIADKIAKAKKQKQQTKLLGWELAAFFFSVHNGLQRAILWTIVVLTNDSILVYISICEFLFFALQKRNFA